MLVRTCLGTPCRQRGSSRWTHYLLPMHSLSLWGFVNWHKVLDILRWRCPGKPPSFSCLWIASNFSFYQNCVHSIVYLGQSLTNYIEMFPIPPGQWLFDSELCWVLRHIILSCKSSLKSPAFWWHPIYISSPLLAIKSWNYEWLFNLVINVIVGFYCIALNLKSG